MRKGTGLWVPQDAWPLERIMSMLGSLLQEELRSRRRKDGWAWDAPFWRGSAFEHPT